MMVTNGRRIQSEKVREPISTFGLIVVEKIPVARLRREYGADLQQGPLLALVATVIAGAVAAFFLP